MVSSIHEHFATGLSSFVFDQCLKNAARLREIIDPGIGPAGAGDDDEGGFESRGC